MRKTALRLLFVVFLVSSCGVNPYSNYEKDNSARAILDYEHNRIIKPLDSYDPHSLVPYGSRASDILYGQCIRQKSGMDLKVPHVTGSFFGQGREYGLWNPEYTSRYGLYDRSQGVEGNNEEYSLNYQKYRDECKTEYVDPKISELGEVYVDTPVYDDIKNQSYGAASHDSGWGKAREKWFDCLRAKGLTPIGGDTSWGVVEESSLQMSNDAPSEEEIRIATIEAQCSKDTGMAQTLADLEASYQAPLIKKHEVQLQAEFERYKAENEKFKKFVLDNQ